MATNTDHTQPRARFIIEITHSVIVINPLSSRKSDHLRRPCCSILGKSTPAYAKQLTLCTEDGSIGTRPNMNITTQNIYNNIINKPIGIKMEINCQLYMITLGGTNRSTRKLKIYLREPNQEQFLFGDQFPRRE
jgi:hypothetical protein